MNKISLVVSILGFYIMNTIKSYRKLKLKKRSKMWDMRETNEKLYFTSAGGGEHWNKS